MRKFILSLFYFISLVIFFVQKSLRDLVGSRFSEVHFSANVSRVIDLTKFTYQDKYKIQTTVPFAVTFQRQSLSLSPATSGDRFSSIKILILLHSSLVLLISL